MSQWTWWRRFYPTQKLSKDQFFKGGSKLLQQIEFGEYEYDPLGQEVYLEEELYKIRCAEITALTHHQRETIDELKTTERTKKNKRVKLIMEAHLENEHARIQNLKEALCNEFSLDADFVSEVMDTFDGTTRELYFYLKAKSEGREVKSSAEVSLMPRMQHEQPRHILKPKERHHRQLWQKIVQNKGIF